MSLEEANVIADAEFDAAASAILQCYRQLAQNNSNIVRELLKDVETFYEWQHYPDDDVYDQQTHSQYFFHSHPSHDKERFVEHGHFHLFVRQAVVPHHITPIAESEEYKKDQSDDLCHLLCISMNEYGYPCGFFTVNHWVVHGLWYEADVICKLLDLFSIQQTSPSSIVHSWLNAIIKLYKPQLKELIYKRDKVIAEWQKSHPAINALRDENLEVLSYFPIEAPS